MTGKDVLENWSRYFCLSENWGDPEMVSTDLIHWLNDFRDAFGYRVHISPVKGAVYAENTGHSEKSWHYIIPGRNKLVMAADIFPETQDIISAWLLAVKMGFGGVGLYPFASWPEKKLYGMLHVDVRQLIVSGNQSLWWHTKLTGYMGINNLKDLNYMLIAVQRVKSN